MDDWQPCQTSACLLGLFDRCCGCLVFSNYTSPIRSTLSPSTTIPSLSSSFPSTPSSLRLGPGIIFHASLPLRLPRHSSSLPFFSTGFDDTLWGIHYMHEAARIQFYSFDETVRNLPLNFLHLTFSQKSPSVLAPCDSSAWTHRCQFHGSRRLDGHKKK